MDFRLTEEQQLIKDMTRKFVDNVVAPKAEELEAKGEYPYEMAAKAWGISNAPVW